MCEEKEVDMTGEIIAMNHSFHGRSIGALSVTGNAHYRTPFNPLLPGVRFVDFNDLDSVKAQITDKTCVLSWRLSRAKAEFILQQKNS